MKPSCDCGKCLSCWATQDSVMEKVEHMILPEYKRLKTTLTVSPQQHAALDYLKAHGPVRFGQMPSNMRLGVVQALARRGLARFKATETGYVWEATHVEEHQ